MKLSVRDSEIYQKSESVTGSIALKSLCNELVMPGNKMSFSVSYAKIVVDILKAKSSDCIPFSINFSASDKISPKFFNNSLPNVFWSLSPAEVYFSTKYVFWGTKLYF
jgi:hypothetical protein